MALIKEQGSLLLHCSKENGKEHELNSEDLLQEEGGTGPVPHLQHRQALQGAEKQQLFVPCTASLLLLLHWDVT